MSSRTYTLAELAAAVNAVVDGDGGVTVNEVGTIADALPGQLSFVHNKKYNRFIPETRASALVLDPETDSCGRSAIRHHNPYLTFARIIDIIHPIERVVPPGVHSSAVVDPTAAVDGNAGIGPLCVVESGAKIGAGSQLISSVHVGREVSIGDNCLLHPGVRILHRCRIGNNVILHAGAVVGSDGFGFAEGEGGIRKIQHIGTVEIGDDVEIGANTTIDRGMLGPTRIGRGTKVDNLVQIAHNVQIGMFCFVAGQVGISGSTKIGNGVVIAGQVGLVGHIEIGDRVMVGAQSGVTKNAKPGTVWFGSPAREIMQAKRIEASIARLPDLVRRLAALEKKVGGFISSGD